MPLHGKRTTLLSYTDSVIKTYFLKLQFLAGVAGVFILWTGTLVSMSRAHLGLLDNRPVSFLGTDPSSRLIFSSSLILSAILFINFAFYVQRTFQVNNRFLKYFLIGQVCQIILAISPYGETAKGVIHLIAAFTLAFSLPLLIKQFTISQHDKQHHKLYLGLLRFEQVGFIIGMGLFIFSKGLAPLGEAMPAIGFHLWIFVVTYVAFTKSKHLS